jgi:hypothetical protein
MLDNYINAETVRGYLKALLVELWLKDAKFNPDYPFGNSAWKHDFYRAFSAEGLIKSTYVNEGGEDMYFYDQHAMNKLIS